MSLHVMIPANVAKLCPPRNFSHLQHLQQLSQVLHISFISPIQCITFYTLHTVIAQIYYIHKMFVHMYTCNLHCIHTRESQPLEPYPPHYLQEQDPGSPVYLLAGSLTLQSTHTCVIQCYIKLYKSVTVRYI